MAAMAQAFGTVNILWRRVSRRFGRQRDRCESLMNVLPAGKVFHSERLLRKSAKIHLETQQAIESALSIPEGLP
jgi:hypothetical protein